MKAFVYILKDEAGRFYIGSTLKLKERFRHHELGHTPSTKRMLNPKIVFQQEADSLKTARKLEQKLKKMKRKDYIEKIVKDGYIRVS